MRAMTLSRKGQRMHRHVLFVLTVGLLPAIFGPATAKAVTDEDVVKALDKAQAYLIGLQQPDGAWPEGGGLSGSYGQSEMALFTLAYIGVHPNRDVMTKALDTVLFRPLQHTYAVSMRAMALAILQKKLAGDKRDTVRQAMNADAVWLETAQGSHGGWDYGSLSGGGGRFDLSNTQMAILALRELALAGHETPTLIWQRAQALYFKLQQQDGGWNYGAGGINIGECPSYGSMTAAGLASIFITSDNLEPGRGCPCRGGKSTLAGATWTGGSIPPSDGSKKTSCPMPTRGFRTTRGRNGSDFTGSMPSSGSASPPGTSTSAPATGTRRGPSIF